MKLMVMPVGRRGFSPDHRQKIFRTLPQMAWGGEFFSSAIMWWLGDWTRIPYRIWFATSHREVETKISFPLFRLFRGNGSWCRISRVQSPSHHIISELKNSPPQAI